MLIEEFFQDRKIRNKINEEIENAVVDDTAEQYCDMCGDLVDHVTKLQSNNVCDKCLEFIKFVTGDYDIVLHSEEDIKELQNKIEEGAVVPNFDLLYNTAKRKYGGDIRKLLKDYGMKDTSRWNERAYTGELYLISKDLREAEKINHFIADFDVHFFTNRGFKLVSDADSDGFSAPRNLLKSKNDKLYKNNVEFILQHPEFVKVGKSDIKTSDDQSAYDYVSNLTNGFKDGVKSVPSSGVVIGNNPVHTAQKANIGVKNTGEDSFVIKLGNKGQELEYKEVKRLTGKTYFNVKFKAGGKVLGDDVVGVVAVGDSGSKSYVDDVYKETFKNENIVGILPFLSDEDLSFDIDINGVEVSGVMDIEKTRKSGVHFNIDLGNDLFKNGITIDDPRALVSYAKFIGYVKAIVRLELVKRYKALFESPVSVVHTSAGDITYTIYKMEGDLVSMIIYFGRDSVEEVVDASKLKNLEAFLRSVFVKYIKKVNNFSEKRENVSGSVKVGSEEIPYTLYYHRLYDVDTSDLTLEIKIKDDRYSKIQREYFTFVIGKNYYNIVSQVEKYISNLISVEVLANNDVQMRHHLVEKLFTSEKSRIYQQVSDNIRKSYPKLKSWGIKVHVDDLKVSSSGSISKGSLISFIDVDGEFYDVEEFALKLKNVLSRGVYKEVKKYDVEMQPAVQYEVIDVEKFGEDIKVSLLESSLRLFARMICEGVDVSAVSTPSGSIPAKDIKKAQDEFEEEYSEEDIEKVKEKVSKLKSIKERKVIGVD